MYHGNAAISTAPGSSPDHFPWDAGLYVDSSSDFVEVTYPIDDAPAGASLAGTPASLELDRAFTIDFWFRLDDVTRYNIIFNRRYPGSATHHYISAAWHPYPNWGYIIITANSATGNSAGTPVYGNNFNTTVENDTWYHYAITRDENYNWQTYLNGEIGGGNSTLPAEYRNQTINWAGSFYIGGGSQNWALSGYISEFRIAKDQVIWTEDFSTEFASNPPGPYGAISPAQTTPALCKDLATILYQFDHDSLTAPIDETGNTTAVYAGNAALSSDSPPHFPTKSSLSLANSDKIYITYPSSLALDGEFTIDFWVKIADISKQGGIFGDAWGGPSHPYHYPKVSMRWTGHQDKWSISQMGIGGAGYAKHVYSNLPVNDTWMHIAITRNASNNYYAYFDGNKVNLGGTETFQYGHETIDWGAAAAEAAATTSSIPVGAGQGTNDANISIDEFRIVKDKVIWTEDFSAEFASNPPGPYCLGCAEPVEVMIFHFDEDYKDAPVGVGKNAPYATYETDTGMRLSSPSHFPTQSSVYFNGSTEDYTGNSVNIEYPPETPLDGDFTIDLWVKFDDILGSFNYDSATDSGVEPAQLDESLTLEKNHQYIFGYGLGHSENPQDLEMSSLNLVWNAHEERLYLIIYPLQSHTISDWGRFYFKPEESPYGNKLESDIWYHFALTRSGTVMYFFINGVLAYEYQIEPYSSAEINWSKGLRLGRAHWNETNIRKPLKGYIDEFRIVRGQAMWTEDFSTEFAMKPPAPYCAPPCIDGAVITHSCGYGLEGNRTKTCVNGVWGPWTTCLEPVDDCVGDSALLLAFNEDDNDGNPVDSGNYNLTVIYEGNAKLRTTDGSSPEHFRGQSSVYFDGSATTPDCVDITYPSAIKLDGDFTITFWIKFDDIKGAHNYDPKYSARAYQQIFHPVPEMINYRWQQHSSLSFELVYFAEATANKYWFALTGHLPKGTSQSSTSIVNFNLDWYIEHGHFSSNTWHHIGITRREGYRMHIFLDGHRYPHSDIGAPPNDAILVYSEQDFDFGGTLRLGNTKSLSTSHRRDFKGYIDDFRIVKGTALYTDEWDGQFDADPPTESCMPSCTPNDVDIRTCDDGVETGEQERVCNERGIWGPWGECEVGPCPEGATRIGPTACGRNLEGKIWQTCVSSVWEDDVSPPAIDDPKCTGTDVCVNGSSQNGNTPCGWNDKGTITQACVSGAWEDKTYSGPGDPDCYDTSGDECAAGTTQTGQTPCGDDGTYQQECLGSSQAPYLWQDTSTCIEPLIGTTVSTSIFDSNHPGVYYWHLEELGKRDIHSNTNYHQYSFSQAGKNVDAYIMDTGINFEHPMLSDIDGNTRVRDLPGHGYNGGDWESGTNADDQSHGAMVALCVGGAGFSQHESGGFGPGVAKEVNFWSAKVCGVFGCRVSAMLHAYNAIMNHNTSTHPNFKGYNSEGKVNPGVINMSIGDKLYAHNWIRNIDVTGRRKDHMPYCSDRSYGNKEDCENTGHTWYPNNEQSSVYIDAMKLVTAPAPNYTPISVVHAAGNGTWWGTNPQCQSISGSPSQAEFHSGFSSIAPQDTVNNNTDPGQGNTICSGATQQYDNFHPNELNPANFSNYGRGVTCWAAGDNITLPGWTWKVSSSNRSYWHIENVSGTSFSSPITAGIVALYLGANPDATPVQAKAWLVDSTSGGTTYGQIDTFADPSSEVALGNNPLKVTDHEQSEQGTHHHAECCPNDTVVFNFNSAPSGTFSTSIDSDCGPSPSVQAVGHNYKSSLGDMHSQNTNVYPNITSGKSVFPGGKSVYLTNDGDRILVTDHEMSWETGAGHYGSGAFLDFYDDFTIDFWISFVDKDDHFTLIESSDRTFSYSNSPHNTSKTHLHIWKIKDNDTWRADIGVKQTQFRTATYPYLFDGSFIENDAWYHVALTRREGKFRLFFNGVHITFQPASHSSTPPPVNTGEGTNFAIETEDLSCNMEKMSLLEFGENISDITGFAQDNREFAVVGLYTSLAAIVDITDPINPFEIARIPGPNNQWRDVKYWNRHVYIGTEGYAGLKVISMDDPDNPVIVNTITDWGYTSHNLHVDNGYLYIVGGVSSGAQIYIYDLATPATPVQVGAWFGDYIHDLEVYNNKIYASAIYTGKLHIIDVADKTSPQTVASFDVGTMSHDCAVTYDEQTLLTAQETPGGHIKIWDISDYNNISLLSEYSAGPGSVHNVYVRPGTNLAVISYYIEGLRVVDISDPSNPVEVGYYDTSTRAGLYDGHWGVYAYLPSGYMISSDRQNGMYIFGSPLTNSSLIWEDTSINCQSAPPPITQTTDSYINWDSVVRGSPCGWSIGNQMAQIATDLRQYADPGALNACFYSAIDGYHSCGLPTKVYIDELRFVKGRALWTQDFNPPTSSNVCPCENSHEPNCDKYGKPADNRLVAVDIPNHNLVAGDIIRIDGATPFGYIHTSDYRHAKGSGFMQEKDINGLRVVYDVDGDTVRYVMGRYSADGAHSSPPEEFATNGLIVTSEAVGWDGGPRHMFKKEGATEKYGFGDPAIINDLDVYWKLDEYNGNSRYDRSSYTRSSFSPNLYVFNPYQTYTTTYAYPSGNIATVNVNTAISYTLSVTMTTPAGEEPFSVTYSSTNLAQNASWISLNASTGEITGTPTSTGTYTFKITTSNGYRNSTVEYNLIVV